MSDGVSLRSNSVSVDSTNYYTNPITTPFEQVLRHSVLKKLCFKGNGTSLPI